MARSVWNGVISFGMVSIPVSLATAVQEKDLSFNQIHKTCGSRIKLQKYCPVDERVVTPDEIVKGFEYSKGKYVILQPEDFEGLPVASMHAIEVKAFVKAEQVDPVYFDRTYYVQPEETGLKPYALLVQALEKKGVSALGQVAFREKEHLCLVRQVEGKLVLETLFYPDEIRKQDTVKADDIKIGEKELSMALSLVDLLEEDFDPAQYQDEYRKALLERITARAEGGEIKEAPEAPKSQVIDLMDALRQSVDAVKKDKRKSS